MEETWTDDQGQRSSNCSAQPRRGWAKRLVENLRVYRYPWRNLDWSSVPLGEEAQAQVQVPRAEDVWKGMGRRTSPVCVGFDLPFVSWMIWVVWLGLREMFVWVKIWRRLEVVVLRVLRVLRASRVLQVLRVSRVVCLMALERFRPAAIEVRGLIDTVELVKKTLTHYYACDG